MAGPSRSTLLTQLHKGLKKQYESVFPDEGRSVLEHSVYGFLLENAAYSVADEAWSSLHAQFYDWNEIRVATTTELAELLHRLPDPSVTSTALRGLLQRTFETRYVFDLEHLRKENLGQAAKQLETLCGGRAFVVAYVVQSALGGHSIPIDRGALDVLAVLGVITPAERQAGSAPGLERAIPKNKGAEFSSLLHQLAADFVANPHSPGLHKTLLEINPAAKDRLPKRQKKAGEEAAAPPSPAKPSEKKASKAAGAERPARSQKVAPVKKPAAAVPTKRKPR